MNVDAVTLATGLIGMLVGAVGAYVALRRDRRESRLQAVTVAEKTIELLESQNRLLTTELGEAKQRQLKLEGRIDRLDQDYRSLVLTVTSMGLCTAARTCPSYNPGDRRGQPTVTIGAEGTD